MTIDKRTATKLLSALVGLGVIACGAYLGAQDHAHADTLILAGLAILGGLGTLGLPSLFSERTERTSPRPPRSRRGSGPPPLPVLLMLLGLAGCSPSALGIQADAAAVVGRVVAEADAVIIAARAADLEAHVTAAREECGPGGCEPTRGGEILAAYDARERAWAPALACREPVVQGLRGWVDAIALARLASSEDLGLGHALAELGRVLALWRGTRACVLTAAAAGGLALELPDLPPWVYALAPGGAS